MRLVGIDPSTKTGFVALDEYGTVLKQKEITGIGSEDPKRMVTLIFELMDYVKKDDFIVIEGFPFDTQRAMFAGGLHHGIRNELFKRNIPFYDVAPNAVKKFVNVTGWKGEVGSKERLKGGEKKKAVKEAVIQHFGYTNPSDNIVDAYIMARIALALLLADARKSYPELKYQAEVIASVINPKPKVKKTKKVAK